MVATAPDARARALNFVIMTRFDPASMRLTPSTYPNLAPEWTKRIGSFQCVEPSA
jgi:hypothetical protein